jgi:hypothetical protein
MAIFAIGDLHLPGGDMKPMDVFGAHWENHFERISEDWRARVKDEDTVLIPGDISWAMQLGPALCDLRRIAELPGRVLILRGNHDYWWSSLTQLRTNLPQGMYAVQNDAFDGGVAAEAYALNKPLYECEAEPRGSLVRTDNTHAVIETVKPAYDGDGFIARVYNDTPDRQRFTVSGRFSRVSITDMLERESTDADASLTLMPYEIKTLRLRK